MECVEHHAAEEEEGKMFPKVRELCDQQELDDLGEELEAAKGRKRKASLFHHSVLKPTWTAISCRMGPSVNDRAYR